jgi:hypothetical protein
MRELGNNDRILLGEILGSIPGRVLENNEETNRAYWPRIKLQAKEIMGISSTESTVRAPFVDRPILQQSFELSPEKGSVNSVPEAVYQARLDKILGSPISMTAYNTTNCHEVRFSSKWKMADFTISLSIYGCERKNANGSTAAGLFFDIDDDVSIARPYLDGLLRLEESLWSDLSNADVIYTTRTKQFNAPFFIRNYEKNIVKIDNVSENLRRSQKALYKHELLETPHSILHQLPENGIMIWTSNGKYFLSSSYDCVNLKPNDIVFYFCNILPARGGGATRLVVGELEIEDEPNSEVLNTLTKRLEGILGQKAAYREYYDD